MFRSRNATPKICTHVVFGSCECIVDKISWYNRIKFVWSGFYQNDYIMISIQWSSSEWNIVPFYHLDSIVAILHLKGTTKWNCNHHYTIIESILALHLVFVKARYFHTWARKLMTNIRISKSIKHMSLLVL